MTAFSSNDQATTTSTATAARAERGAAQPLSEVAPAQVQQWLRSGEAVLIDVREPDEHAREKIAGSRLLPLSRFDPGQAAGMAKPGQTIVLHCRSGRRSSDACRMAVSLAESGAIVLNMTGGIEAWKKDALPVEVNTRVSGVSVMRQVQLVIGVGVLAGAALAWFVDPRFVAITAFFGAGLTFAGATGTCTLATAIGWMPWNRAATGGKSCASGSCG
jgi:rhodanese-related sulfurtransferase